MERTSHLPLQAHVLHMSLSSRHVQRTVISTRAIFTAVPTASYAQVLSLLASKASKLSTLMPSTALPAAASSAYVLQGALTDGLLLRQEHLPSSCRRVSHALDNGLPTVGDALQVLLLH